MEQSPNLVIDCLPGEVLLEIFDSYRQNIFDYHPQGVDQYDHQWRKKYAWFNLAHVCRRWRSVVFASSTRLDLNVIVGPEKPNHIKTILSGHLPIFIDYSRLREQGDITGSALWRMRASLRHRDRVREISISDVIIEKFTRATSGSHYFPALESLVLSFPSGPQADIPATFLRGPDQSHLLLRRLRLKGASLASVSGLLLSATALTDLTLNVPYNAAGFDSSSLVACLQGMKYLRSLKLSTSGAIRSQRLTLPKDIIVPLLKLTRFHYHGPTLFLNDLMSGLSAPSLQDVRFVINVRYPILCLSRLIDDVTEDFLSVSVSFDVICFQLLSSTHLGKVDHFNPSFRFSANYFADSIESINSTPPTKLAMAQELTLNFPNSIIDVRSLCEFLRQFRGVKVLRLKPFILDAAPLQKDEGEAILPLLEEIELSISRFIHYSDKEYERRVGEALAAFELFVSARERVGRPVKVYHCEQMQT